MKQFITDNLFIVVMVGVTVLALIGVVFPVLQIGAANEYASQLSKIDSQLTNAMRDSESPLWLEKSNDGLNEIKKTQEEVIEKALKKATRLPLLVKDKQSSQDLLVFPNPDIIPPSRFSKFDFPQAYLNHLASLLKEMGAGDLPTAEEVAAAVAEDEKRIRSRINQEVPANHQQIIRDKLIGEKAVNIRIWASMESFDNYVKTLKKPGSAEVPIMSEQQLWEALISWWIQKDVCDVIAQFNSRSFQVMENDKVVDRRAQNVLDSPIKELVRFRIKPGYYPQRQTAGPANAAPQPTLTGRQTNERYHVMLYDVQIVMDPSRFNEFMGALQAKNFHTVLSYQQDTLERKGKFAGDSAAAAARTARPVSLLPGQSPPVHEYGGNSVAVFTLNCEAIFMNSPASWRPQNPRDTDISRQKRLAFLRAETNRRLVLEVHEIRGNQAKVALSYADLQTEQGRARLDDMLKPENENKNLRFIFLYEDLMPEAVKKTLPGYSSNSSQ